METARDESGSGKLAPVATGGAAAFAAFAALCAVVTPGMPPTAGGMMLIVSIVASFLCASFALAALVIDRNDGRRAAGEPQAVLLVPPSVSAGEGDAAHPTGSDEGVFESVSRIEAEFEQLLERYNASLESTGRHRRELAYALRRENAELRGSNHRLIEVDRLKDEFVSLLAHELKTPLAAMRSHVEILTSYIDTLPGEQRREYLAVVESQLDRSVRLIDELLDVSRIHGGRLKLTLERLEVGPEIDQVIKTLLPLAHDRGQRLETAATPSDGALTVRADKDRLFQILTNVVGNAIKYGRENGRIRLEARPYGAERIEIMVSDDGPGVAPEEREQVFEAFYRSPNTARVEGSGLGLFLSRELSRRMGGDLLAEDSTLGGAGFVLRLPRASILGAIASAQEGDGGRAVAAAVSGAPDTSVAAALSGGGNRGQVR